MTTVSQKRILKATEYKIPTYKEKKNLWNIFFTKKEHSKISASNSDDNKE